MTEERALVDWKTLKKLGWPYCRQHTYRMIAAGRFAKPLKLAPFRGGRVAWRWSEVKPFLGLPINSAYLDE